MESNKMYIYTVLMQNSKSFWKFLIAYVISLFILFGISDVYYEFSTPGFILTIIYIVLLWIITIWLTVYFLKALFTGNQFLNWKLFNNDKTTTIKDNVVKENNISKLSENIEEQFIKYWYNEISRNDTFPSESRVIIINTLKMFSEVLEATDKTFITYAVGNIFLKHLKEFRRTLKLNEKNGAKITEIYRCSFSSLPTRKCREYYVYQMTKNLLVNFIHWELWNSIPCQLVVSIISRKLSDLMEMCANPDYINYYLLRSFISDIDRNRLKLDEYAYVRIEVTEQTDHPNKIARIIIEEERKSRDDAVSKDIETEQRDESMQDVMNTPVPDKPNSPEKIEDKCEVTFTPCETLVKVYEPKSASKTWNEALDLGSISMGEDPLRSSIHSDSSMEVQDLHDISEADSFHEDREIPHLNNNNKTLLEEVKHMTSMEGLKNTMKPFSDATVNTLRDIKDFQENTVNSVVKPVSHATSQALHKFGDLQDEAAGVVEGLFDFGMAGIRKGLKLTGLQENPSQEAVSDNKIKNLLASPGVKAQKKIKRLSKAELAEEGVWLNPLQDNPSFDDDAASENGKLEMVPSITMDSSEYESPDPEYEEAADLASTIAKLRSLLQQKSSESASATPAASPMVVEDTKAMMDMDDVDSFVPSFYKLCAKTATGVFNNTLNTIKTALPVNANEIITYDVEKWDYEEVDDKELNLLTRMNKLLHERQDFCMIETAYDAFDSQHIPDVRKRLSNINYRDELDELETRVPLAKTFIDIICELIADSDTFISQEPFVKFILLVLGQSIDDVITTNIRNFLDNITITEISTTLNQEVLTMELDVFIDYLISGIPDALIFFIGHSTIKDALNILVSSIQMRKCNHDIILQIFEFVSLRLKEESMKNNTLYSTL